jgi:hypothetical protein
MAGKQKSSHNNVLYTQELVPKSGYAREAPGSYYICITVATIVLCSPVETREQQRELARS